MERVVVSLYVAGGLLPIASLAWAVWMANRRYRTLDAKLQWLDRVAERVDVARDEAAITEWLEVYAGPGPEAGHPVLALYASEIAQREIFRQLRRPAYLAGTGVLLGTLGSLLSLKL